MADGEQSTGPVGLVGLGNMGSALARRLAAQYPLIAYDVRPTDAMRELAASGAFTLAGSLLDVAAARRVVLSLPAPDISRAVVTELLGVLAPGSVIVETSTVTPMDIAAMRGSCESASVTLLDAAILSGVRQSAEGVATILVGGDTGDVDSVRDNGHAVRGGRDGGGVVNSEGQAWRAVRQSRRRPDQAADAPLHGTGARRRIRRRHADRGRA